MNIIKVIDPQIFIKELIHGQEILKKIELIGRLSHKSEEKIGPGTAEIL